MDDDYGNRSRGLRRVGRHYLLLLWKNFILAKRMPKQTLVEILVPVFFGFILLGIRHVVKSETFKNDTVFPPFSIDKLPTFQTGAVSMIGYTSNTSFHTDVMDRVAHKLGLYVQEFSDEDALVKEINKNMPQSIFIGGVVFTNTDSEFNITYKIRLSATLRNAGSGGIFNGDNNWKTILLYPLFPIVGPRSSNDSKGGTPGYYREGFLAIQRAVDMSILEELNPTFNSSNINIKLQRYPYPPYKGDNFVLVIQIWFPFLLVMSYIFAAIITVKNIVYEKENGLKVAMTIMGLNSWIHWASWFTRSLIFLIIADILIAVCYIVKVPLKNGDPSSVIGESDITLVFFFLFTYSITSICFMFLISTFFDKANSAAAGTGGLWFLSYLPYAFIQPRYETMTRAAKMGTCLLHNIGLSLGAQLIGQFEGKGTGLQWSMFNEPVSVDDNFTMQDVIIMLYIDAAIYLLFALYIENIWPGQYGIPKSFYYPFQLSYWRGYTTSNVHVSDECIDEAENNNSAAFESEPVDKELGVQLNNVSKTYSFLLNNRPPVHAVQNLSMNIYRGQLTALLGHNGAGKSTTISMITGLIPPTSGQIIVNGYDIATSMDKVRDNLGLCPQYNILFDHLTVREHLKLFATLKGHPSNDINNEIEKMVKDLRLSDKLDTLSSALSGGMKRKLSVGIALIANSKVVILDEPTSGMDPAARRSTWDMLQRFRMDRTILFTTHFMDEADILGDRIAIMGDGRARCCGSSFFLKTQHGIGSHLILSKDARSDAADILRLVQKHIPEAKLESAISAECKILLPYGSSAKFPGLFEDLEQHTNDLQIFSIGLSETSMEEVFMKIVEADEPDEIVTTNSHQLDNNGYAHTESGSMNEEVSVPLDNLHQSMNGMKIIPSQRRLSVFDTEIQKNTGTTLMLQQFYALLLKRITNSKRNYLVLFCAILPVLFVIISLIIDQQIPQPGDSPPLLMSLNRYESTNVPYVYDPNEALSTDFIRSYEYHLQQASKVPTLIDLTSNTTRPCHDGKTTDIISYLACIGRRSLLELSDRYLIGANVHVNSSDDTIDVTGLFNNQPFHVPPLTLNYITNALLKQYSTTSTMNTTIHVVNHPLPRSLTETISDFQSQQFFGFRMASSIVFGLGFLMAAYTVFLIKERVSKAKHLQFLSGADGFSFWFSTFIWDLFYYTLAILLIFIVWTIFYLAGVAKDDLAVYLTKGRLGYSVLLYVLYGFSQIPMTYLFTYLFRIPASGFAWITIYNIITSQATLLAIVILSIPQLELLDIANILEWVFLLLFPNYCLGQGLNDIYQNSFLVQLCEPLVPLCPFLPNPCCKDTCGTNCVSWTTNYLGWEKPGIGRFLVFMILQSVVSFTILLLIDYRILPKMWYFISRCCRFSSVSNNTEHIPNHTVSGLVITTDNMQVAHEDEDVKEEAERIQNTHYNELMLTDVLVLNQVEKVYNGVFHAVDQLSVGVKKSECFGLLGVNGAGKTTTFKMITGDETIDAGTIILDSLSLSKDMRRAQQRMGYCPQFDALIDLLTGEETLYMFARLRGVKEFLIPNIVNSLITLMNLRKHANKPVYAYSGGNKRKLSAAIALIGDPAIVFLDEPTTGMDPKARRHFWNAIAQFRDHGKPIILTSHSMEECEALCTRLAIMVNGKFKCLGSIQHLKSKFGSGYTLMAKLNVFDENSVTGFYAVIQKSFPNSHLKEAYEGFIHIHINQAELSLAALFRVIESCKETFSIENYTVSQTTLEQVFLNFALSQLDPDELLRRMRTEKSWTTNFIKLDVLAELASSQKPIVNDSSIKQEFETSNDETNLSLSISSSSSSSSLLNSSIKSEGAISTNENTNTSLSPTFVLKTTQKGKPCILLDGHRYKHRRDNLDGSMSWTCTHELCSASVRTFGERVVRRNDDHLHGRTLRVDPQQEFLSRLKKRAAEDTVTIPRIYDEELARSVDEHSPEIRSHLPSFSSVKSTLYRHRQRGQRNQASKLIKTELNIDCKSSSINSTTNTSGWNTLPPKKRPLTINVDCLPTPSPSSCCSSSSYSYLSSESQHGEKRRKYSSSSSTTFTEDNTNNTNNNNNNNNNNNTSAQMAVAAALESQQLIAKFLSNPYNLLLAQNYFAKYSTTFADNPHFMLMHAYALVLSSLQQQQQQLM
ncbi:unnamed protein product [Adineta steineri]|nr:unnamed protein product [Adineta steineri]